MKQFILKQETYEIIGSCMEVHKKMGAGFSEVIYKEALEIEFIHRGIHFEREKKFSVEYRGQKLQHSYFADFIVLDKVILEVKAVSNLTDAHVAQTLNYLRVSGCNVGLLINFNEDRLAYQRLVF
ncbi:MAG: NADH:ubiquinone oxidoreductase [Candidatus Fluviicola riflensis]|nr:MAG: GxxExxY protein [Candidatus Fluviicola riflensis]OGS77386.1 MAG: NADH:ubiquinone oxidoreductase [Candidatus Fluviicola riflensis]OGS83966.1 MAG: NADH:ubiquinone oxidoreductase [Fluviicola sp. RIFCSPHIGHO2_12_FULL_43_24]OGS84453.1 MAG: NADH:ubiquinone oxidoreductase [Fluviicola sp. RIFCSPHIGHO2_01_FULL_43_53]